MTPDERKKVLEYFQHKVKLEAEQFGHLPPGQARPAAADGTVQQQESGAQGTPPTGVTEAGAQLGETDASKDGLKRPPGAKFDGRVPKQSVSSEEEKTDDADLGDFLGRSYLCIIVLGPTYMSKQ